MAGGNGYQKGGNMPEKGTFSETRYPTSCMQCQFGSMCWTSDWGCFCEQNFEVAPKKRLSGHKDMEEYGEMDKDDEDFDPDKIVCIILPDKVLSGKWIPKWCRLVSITYKYKEVG